MMAMAMYLWEILCLNESAPPTNQARIKVVVILWEPRPRGDY